MDLASYNQSFNHSSSLDEAHTEEVPLFATYLSMVTILIATIIVITPAVMIINVIWWTKELPYKVFLLCCQSLRYNWH